MNPGGPETDSSGSLRRALRQRILATGARDQPHYSDGDTNVANPSCTTGKKRSESRTESDGLGKRAIYEIDGGTERTYDGDEGNLSAPTESAGDPPASQNERRDVQRTSGV